MSLESRVAALETVAATVTAVDPKELDTFYIMFAACLVFLMQAGFAMLEAGSVRSKNVKNVLLKNLLDACFGAIIWYLIGFGISGGGNEFMGTSADNYALSGLKDTGSSYTSGGYDWISFFFSFTFAAAASTIVSGAVAERCQLAAYIIYTCIITGWIYPVVVHWVWNGDGFLSAFNPDHILGGNIDFAGSGVVHMTGGIAGLAGAAILGPRKGRWEDPSKFQGHSTPLQVVGTFLLWFGWYGFNGGSTLYINTYGRDAGRVCVTTTMSAAVGGVVAMLLKKFLPPVMGGSGDFDVSFTCNGILAGLVGITAGCPVISVHLSLLVGFISAFVLHGASCLLHKLKIDDPLDAFAVHGACGAWGVLAVGLFAMQGYSYVPNPGSSEYDGEMEAGAFTGKGSGLLLGTQIVAIIIEVLWVGTTSSIMFFLLKVAGLLRVSAEVEEKGLDDSKHGGSAYQGAPGDGKSGSSY